MIPQITDKTKIKTTGKIPDLEDCKYQPLVNDVSDIINSPIFKLDENPPKYPLHADNLSQEKEGKQPNANETNE